MRLLRIGLHYYMIGILILTLGITLTIQSALGTSPFDALTVGLFRTFGLSVGTWEIIVGSTLVLCNAIAEKKRPEYYAILTSFVTGIGIDFWLFLIGDWVLPQTWVSQSVCLGIGILLIGIGVAAYLQSRIAPNPMDRSMLIISKSTGWNVSYSRALISIILVIIALFFNGAIGVGTLINALVSGTMIGFFLPYMKILKRTSEMKRNHAS